MTVLSLPSDLSFGNKPHVKVMFDGTTSKEIRICMDTGNIMQEHKAPGAITIMLLKGSVRISSNNK